MKRNLISLFYFLFLINLSFSQAPAIEWENTIGGNSEDAGTSIKQTPDHGYILAGYSNSTISGDKTGYDGGYDLWVLKLDSNGLIEWQNTIGGTNSEYNSATARMVIESLSDGGYLLGGNSQSGISGDKTEINIAGSNDLWVLKLDELGNIIWQNTIGGAGTDYLSALLPIDGGGCIIGAQSDSPISADKLEASWGGYDYWIFELDEFGNIIWQNTIGGDQNDYLGSISKTEDGGYLLTGDSNSGITGDKSEPSVLGDYWIVKVDAVGNIIWDNTIGGLSSEFYARGIMTTDSGYLIGGVSLSGIGLDKSQPQIGTYDYWVVKLTTDGEIVWDKTIGGGNLDYFSSLISTIDNCYLIGGYSNSGISGVKTDASHGFEDYWIVKLNEIGNIVWQKTIGGWGNDYLRDIIQTNDNGYTLIGSSNSLASFEKTENYIGPSALSDYWVVKLAPDSCYSSIETCNGLDDDCNGIIDDSFIYTTYFADTDGDGFGDIDNVTTSCTGFPPVGYVVDSTDCNDLNILIHPDTIELCNGFDDNCNILIDEGLSWYTFYFDGDEDGFGDVSSSITLCNPVLPSGYSTDSTDCNDDNISVFPGAIELCNSIDDNCNGSIDEGFTIYVYFLDSDDDGFGDPDIAISTCLFPAPEGYVSDNTDCDDSNEFIYAPILYFIDADGDLYGDFFSPIFLCEIIAPSGFSVNDQDCDDTAFFINPGSNEICNAIDDNCNLEIDEGLTVFILYADVDGDAFGDPDHDSTTCTTNISGFVNDSTDCDDTNPFIYPGAEEILNGVDDNCNKLIDEGVGIEDFENTNFNIYPNPSRENIIITLSSIILTTPHSPLIITDLSGKIISEIIITSFDTEVDISNFAAGIYFVKILIDDKQLTGKFIKQ